jgi:hypothetical protein
MSRCCTANALRGEKNEFRESDLPAAISSLIGDSGGEFGVRGWLPALDVKNGNLRSLPRRRAAAFSQQCRQTLMLGLFNFFAPCSSKLETVRYW